MNANFVQRRRSPFNLLTNLFIFAEIKYWDTLSDDVFGLSINQSINQCFIVQLAIT